MRSACAPAVVGLLLGCTPTATQPPESTGAVAEPAAAADEPVEGDAPEEAGAAEAGAPTPEPATADDGASTVAANGGEPTGDGGTPPVAVTSDDGGSEAPTTEPEPTKPTVTTLELPKPLHGKPDASCGKDPGVGERLKPFSLPGIEGTEPITAGTFRGRVLVVNFWGTWCKPCLKELPEFDQLYRRYRKHGMTLLAIATDEDAQAVKDIVSAKKWGAKIAIAGEDYAGQYGSAKFPFTFIVDHTGVIKASYRGYKPECMGQLEADIREQLEVRFEAKAKRKKG
jgi:thiol-disulfide isomerase/thioredoxin